MPRFNAAGDLCIGLGRDWFDHRTIAQECNTLRPGCVIALSDGTIVREHGTNQIVAGYGVWACVPFPAGGYVDSFGRTLSDRVPQTIGPDGAICLRPNSNAFAEVWEPSGERWRLAEKDITDVQLLGHRRAIWVFQGGLEGVGFDVPPTPAGAWGWPRLIEVNGQFKLLYQSYSAEALVFDGRIVARGVNFFRPDAVQIGDAIHFCWALEPQEYGVTPAPLVMSIAALLALPVLQNVGSSPQVPTLPQPSPEPKPVPVSPVPDLSAVVKRVRGFYSTPLGADHAEFLAHLILALEAAQPTLEFGLYRKSGGTHIRMPSGIDVSQDIIAVHRGTELWTYDVLGSGETKATPMWKRTEPTGIEKDVKKFYQVQALDLVQLPPVPAPTPVTDPVTTVPDPVTPAPSADTSAILKSIEDLRSEARSLSAKLAQLEGIVDSTQGRISNAETRLYALKPFAKPGDAVEVTGSISLTDALRANKVTWAGKIK